MQINIPSQVRGGSNILYEACMQIHVLSWTGSHNDITSGAGWKGNDNFTRVQGWDRLDTRGLVCSLWALLLRQSHVILACLWIARLSVGIWLKKATLLVSVKSAARPGWHWNGPSPQYGSPGSACSGPTFTKVLDLYFGLAFCHKLQEKADTRANCHWTVHYVRI